MTGIEWLIEAFGCADARLQDQDVLEDLFETIVNRMELKPVGDSVWHQFPENRGLTGVWLLQESHLTIHTFPEYRSACLNIFCCTPRPALDWRATLFESLGATDTKVFEHKRVYHRRS